MSEPTDANAQNFMQLAWENFELLKQYEGPDQVHALSRLAICQQLKRCADLLAAVQASLNDLSTLPGLASVMAGGIAELGQLAKDAGQDRLVLSGSLGLKRKGKKPSPD